MDKLVRQSACRVGRNQLEEGRRQAAGGDVDSSTAPTVLSSGWLLKEVVELILKKAGEDVLKQIELAAAVKHRLTDVNPNKDLPVSVALAIVESVKSWLKEIKNKFKGKVLGRFKNPNDIRSLYH